MLHDVLYVVLYIFFLVCTYVMNVYVRDSSDSVCRCRLFASTLSSFLLFSFRFGISLLLNNRD